MISLRDFAAATLAIAGSVGAQDEEFVRAYSEAEELRLGGADAAVVRTAYRRAVDRFRAIEPAAADFARLPAAGFAAMQIGEHRLAGEWFTLAIERGRPTAWLIENRLRAMVRAGDHVAALRCAHDDRVEHAEAVARVYDLAESAAFALRTGATELGLAHFRAAAASRDSIALANLALALRSVGDGACEATYREALAKAPNDAVLWNDFGLFLKGVGRTEEALAAFRASLDRERSPYDGPAIGNLVDLQRSGTPAGIEDPAVAVTRVLATRPDSAMSRRRCIDAILGR